MVKRQVILLVEGTDLLGLKGLKNPLSPKSDL